MSVPETTRRGRLGISRVGDGRGGGFVRIELFDQASRTECVEIEVPVSAFAEALFGRGSQPAAFRLRPDRVGLRHERKTEVVVMPEGGRAGLSPDEALALLAPHEVDGWTGRLNDVFNHHKLVTPRFGPQKVRVFFERWVEPEPGWEPEP